jgi:hypothetical protein
MSEDFFKRPILNSPYDYPARHWELDSTGQPTQIIATSRRRADFITPIPKPKKRKTSQGELHLEDEKGLSTANQQYDLKSIINQVRGAVDACETWGSIDSSISSGCGSSLQFMRPLHSRRDHQIAIAHQSVPYTRYIRLRALAIAGTVKIPRWL